MTLEANKTIVRKFMRLFSEAKLDEAFALLSEHLVWSLWGNGPAAGNYDRTTMRAMLEHSFGFFIGPLEWTPTGITAEEDRVAVEAVSHAVTPGGFVYSNHYHSLFKISGGKIVEVKEMFEESSAQALMDALQAEAAAPTHEDSR